MRYFIRPELDSNYHMPVTLRIACLLTIVLAFAFFFYRNKNNNQFKYLRIVGAILLFNQIAITTWCMTYSFDAIQTGLPLYFCRFSSLIIGFFLMIGKEDNSLVKFLSLFSIFGATVALIMPDMYHYNFPHITSVTYVIIHGLLLYSSLFISFNINIVIDDKMIFIYTGLIYIFISSVNRMFDANYSYLSKLPPPLTFVPNNLSFFVVAFFTVIWIRFINDRIDSKYEQYKFSYSIRMAKNR